MPLRLAVLVFHGVEILDFAGPLEVLAPLGCLLVGEAREVTCQGGLRVLADHVVAEQPPIDVLVVPGGPGTRRPESETQPLVDYIRGQAATAQIVASVCTGAFLLGRAGLLDGRRATTHWRWRNALAERHPSVQLTGGRVVDAGGVVTAAGVSAGVDLGLHLVGRLQGAAAAAEAARRIEWPAPQPGMAEAGPGA
ncbi:MAG TPA: DJ-1/PfpI family protein [Bacillota bacterium]|nr:DJ-1/PfpI family protein [Bacillota bacterium]